MSYLETSGVLHRAGILRIETLDSSIEQMLYYRDMPIVFLPKGALTELVNTDNTDQFKAGFNQIQPNRNIWREVHPDRLYHFLAQAAVERERLAVHQDLEELTRARQEHREKLLADDGWM